MNSFVFVAMNLLKSSPFFSCTNKVKLFWEGHKNLHNLPYGFDVCCLLSKCQNHDADCAFRRQNKFILKIGFFLKILVSIVFKNGLSLPNTTAAPQMLIQNMIKVTSGNRQRTQMSSSLQSVQKTTSVKAEKVNTILPPTIRYWGVWRIWIFGKWL